MSRERRALAAFLLLGVLATVPAVLFGPDPGIGRSQTATRTAPSGLAGPAAPSVHTGPAASDARTAARRLARQHQRAARMAEIAALRRANAASTCRSVPLYPLAMHAVQHRDIPLLRAVNRVAGVPVVSRMERFGLGRTEWLGGDGVPVSFLWYRERMRPIGFAAMPASVRREIGVRPTGPVDSPALLFANATGAALLQALRSGVVRLTLFCGPVEL